MQLNDTLKRHICCMNPSSEIAIPRTSVVNPVYNIVACVEEAIVSIQTQTVQDMAPQVLANRGGIR
jgi:hypothetical protein